MPPWLATPAQRYRAILVAAAVFVCFLVVRAAWAALVPFFVGLIFAYMLLPAVNFLDRHAPKFLRRKRLARPLAILIVYIGLAGIIAGMLAYFIPAVIKQANVFAAAVPAYVRRINALLTEDLTNFLERIPPEISKAVQANLDKATETLATALQKGVGGTIRTLWQTVSFILGMAIVPIWLFYVLNDHEKGRRAFYQLIPEKAREDVRCIEIILDNLLGAYVRGQLLLCLLVGVMATIVLLVFRVDLALLLGTFAGLFEIVPIVGPYIGAAPAVLIALLNRPLTGLWVALSFAGIQQFENIFLVPRISGSAVRFHPAVVIVLVIVGAEVAGLWGIVLAVPLAAMLRDIFRYLYLRTTEQGATPQMALENLRARMR